ncbi:MAG: family 20 glycosylhydrolase [Chitinophagaceae bacterium]
MQYAANRYITIIPTIEMPGHSVAALASYPSLGCTGGPYKVQETWSTSDDVYCAGNDSTFVFLQDVLNEVIQLFPGKYIAIGGDEVSKTLWKKCLKCQKRIKDNNLKDEGELQSYFIKRIEKYLNAKGKQLIGADEILEGGLPPNVTVAIWRDEQYGIDAVNQNHQVIMIPEKYVFLNYSQTLIEDSITIGRYTSVEKIYGYEPVPENFPAGKLKLLLGAQGMVWTEYMNNPKMIEYMMFPRLSALSEVLWSFKENRSWIKFEKKLLTQFKRYDLWKANYSKAYFDLKTNVLPTENGDGVYLALESPIKNTRIVYQVKTMGNDKDKQQDKNSIYTKPIKITANSNVRAWVMIGNKRLSNEITKNIYFNKATGKKILLAKNPSSDTYNLGAFSLVDGVLSEENRPQWLGWRSEDIEATIDLGKAQMISRVNFHTRQVNRHYFPQAIEVFVSTDGNAFTLAGKSTEVVKNELYMGNMTVIFSPTTARYIKVVASKRYNKIPEGKQDAGHDAWMSVDEIQVN